MVTHDPDQAREVSRSIQVIDGQISDFQIYAPLQSLAKAPVKANESPVENIESQEVVDV
jgi:putative ABC transport system ATP-binding protein